MGSALLINVLLFSVFLLDASSLAVKVRSKCESRDVTQKFIEGKDENEMKSRLQALRGEMLIHSDHRGPQISAYIVTTFDEHQTYQTDDTEGQLQFISGFSGPTGYAVISSQAAALWIDAINFEQADSELSCEWEIFSLSEEPSIAQWLANHVQQDSSIGADPKVVPHQLWHEWEREFRHHYLNLVKVKNLIDIIWIDKPQPPRDYVIRTQSSEFAGEAWQQKVQKLRKHLRTFQCDSMVITSLTEIAYLLNLRGGDFRYLPVFTSYAIINKDETLLYTNKSKISMQADLLLNANLNGDPCSKPPCVIVKHYHEFWRDLRFFSRQWKRVLLPSDSNIEMGASEAIRASLPPEIIFHHTSPIIRMRAVKNPVEREGMRRAHLKDAAAMCETLSYLEERFDAGDTWNEEMLAKETDKSRYEQQDNRGLSYRTIVAFGSNAAKLHYYPKPNASTEITNTNLILIDSGGQYLDGTTAVARTIHLGQPTVEQKKAYTNALLGLIRLSTLIFPHDINPSSLDSIIRGPTWTERQDYQHLTGSGIGSYLSAVESPISIAYSIKHPYHFRGGNFFSVAPGIYKPDKFGIRLKNVFEVLSDEKDSGFFNMQPVTLVPFQTKLIDRNSLSPADKKWLNRYNAEIRIKVGVELKQQLKMTAFYWMMNQTAHITEYTTKEDLRAASSSGQIDISMLLLSSFVFIASFFSHSA